MARRRRKRNHIPRRARVLGAVAAAVASVALVLSSCRTTTSQPFDQPPLTAVPLSEPVVRVRVATNQPSVRIDGPGIVEIRVLTGTSPGSNAPGRANPARTFATPLVVTRQSDRFVLQGSGSSAMSWQVDALMVKGETNSVSINNTAYPGDVALHAHRSDDNQPPGVDAVNHVLMEAYLPGVIERELYSHWHARAFEVQAIAARSYAIAQLHRTRRRHYDLESTTSSQVYGGRARNHRAITAVQQTRGVVLMWQDQVLPAYYSSSCGGSAQDAAAVFPNATSIPPLGARNHGNYCANSSNYRWGPITRDRAALSKRIAAWGKSNQMSIGNLKSIAAIGIAARNSVGRPTSFSIQDASGTVYTLGPEHFRFACNFNDSGVPALTSASQLKSSHVTPAVNGRNVVFSDGRGHGHGVGMCQHGTQTLAQQNYDAASILNFYYPQAPLKRLY